MGQAGLSGGFGGAGRFESRRVASRTAANRDLTVDVVDLAFAVTAEAKPSRVY
jgi:hypothetical protein